MGYIVSCLLVLFLLSFLIFSGNKNLSKFGNSFLNSKAFASVSSQSTSLITTNLSKEEITKLLKKLAASKPPSQIKNIHALCYSQALPAEKFEYVCPKCGEKTIYAYDPSKNKFNIDFLGYELSECRRLIKEIKVKGLNAQLDELEFCKKCCPQVTSARLILIVKYPGDKGVHRVKGVTANDLKLIWEFLSGKDKHVGNRDDETPLKDYLPRLQELLGIKNKQ